MAQQRAVSAAEHRGQAECVLRQGCVSDCVNPAVNPMEPPGLRCVPESFLQIPELRELQDRDDAMLLIRQGRQSMVTSPFSVHMDY